MKEEFQPPDLDGLIKTLNYIREKYGNLTCYCMDFDLEDGEGDIEISLVKMKD